MNIKQIRDWEFSMMEKNIASYESILKMQDAAALTTYRDGGTGWTALEVLCHLRDFEGVYLERAHITVEKIDGLLPFPKPDDLVIERRYNEQNPDDVLSEWKAYRTDLLMYLRARADSDWERTAVHPVRGILTLHDQLFLLLWHDSNHLEQMTRTLNEKKTS